jgi:hypothetical protein
MEGPKDEGFPLVPPVNPGDDPPGPPLPTVTVIAVP